jgi:hypothetical protein
MNKMNLYFLRLSYGQRSLGRIEQLKETLA